MGGAYIHGHEPRRGSVVIVNVGIDIVVSKVVCIVVCIVVSKVSDLARTMSKIYAI